MTNAKTTKRALFASAMSMLLCVSMLIGSTFAWFTDTVTNNSNKIVAGTLDVQLLMDADVDGNYDDISNSTNPIFGAGSIAQNNNAATLWEPGKTQVAYLAIQNGDSLDLKYTVGLNVQNVSKDLYEVMEYAIVPDADANNKVTSWTSGNSVVVGTQSVSGDVKLKKGETHYFALVIHMNEDAGSEYMGGQVNFDLTVLATQTNSESDSFGSDYDINAKYPWDGTIGELPTFNENVLTISTATELAAFANDVNVNGNNYSGKTVVLANNIDLNNKIWTPIGQTGATQFLGTFDGKGYTISNLNIDSTAETGAHYSSGLFGWLNRATVKNVKINGAKVTGNHNVAVIAGYMETSGCTISNCSVTNATVVANHANGEACGDKAGVIVGHAGNAGVKVENCSATDCTVTAGRDAGQIVGAAKVANVTGCTANNVTVAATGNCTGANINNAVIGREL